LSFCHEEAAEAVNRRKCKLIAPLFSGRGARRMTGPFLPSNWAYFEGTLQVLQTRRCGGFCPTSFLHLRAAAQTTGGRRRLAERLTNVAENHWPVQDILLVYYCKVRPMKYLVSRKAGASGSPHWAAGPDRRYLLRK
jgi:hypothetical protein